MAPFRKRELRKQEELCGVLKEHFGIEISLEDFCSVSHEDGEPLYHVRPLCFARVETDNRLLIATCNYELCAEHEQAEGELVHFAVATDSVKFHLIEAVQTIKRQCSRSATAT